MKHRMKRWISCIFILLFVASCEMSAAGTDMASVRDGVITREDGVTEYGSPEGEQEYQKREVKQTEAEYFDRYARRFSAAGRRMLRENAVTEMSADIRKRTRWTDESNGDGEVTLQYRSDSGTVEGMETMNVVLVQDKSGSMDANYGYNLEVVRQGWRDPQSARWYPIQNSSGWSETLSDIAKESGYASRLNGPSGRYDGWRGGWLDNMEMTYNSPCQEDGHYYLMTREDPSSDMPAWVMTHGNNLYNISHTDLHHYAMIDASERHGYLEEGRRVVRVTEGRYYDESGEAKQVTDPVYFLDITQIVDHGSGWILSTCAPAQCQTNDRLAKSQNFFNALIDRIRELNPENKIAYIPFWGDVPDSGAWSNAHANGTTDGLYHDNAGRMTYIEGVSRIDFTTDAEQLKNQISHPFTYDGTNWARAFQSTLTFLEGRSEEDKERETLIIFLTDGVPQGTVGTSLDSGNPKINGADEIERLKKTGGVTVYACGVGINQFDQTGLKNRMDEIDSTGQAAYVRHTASFDEMEAEILERIDRQFVVRIEGEDAFYTDTLSEAFSVKESGLGEGWKVLDAPAGGVVRGVPANVYQAAGNGAKYVYVRSTRTVYWNIGTMSDGGYTDAGHEMSFPVSYMDYQVSTRGENRHAESNTVQKLTYVTTRDPDTLQIREMDTPVIIFNRQESPGITVYKTLAGASFTEDTAYRFVYSAKKQTDRHIKGYLGAVEVTVKAGETSGKAQIRNLDPGIYYIYEVDEKDERISAQVGEVKLSESAVITTEAADADVPLSARSSDGEVLDNLDNVLTITTGSGSVEFLNEYVQVDVEKVWDDGGGETRPAEVTVDLYRDDKKIDSMNLKASEGWKGTFKNLLKNDAQGNAYRYTVKEAKTVGYESEVRQKEENAFVVTNRALRSSIRIRKMDADGKNPLEGAVFEIKDSKGKLLASGETGPDGEILFDQLLPDTYTVTETRTPAGHTLLKEPLVVTVPVRMSEEEAKEKRIDKEQCVYYEEEGTYLLCRLTCEVTNNASFVLPMTGGIVSWRAYVPLVFGALLLICAGYLFRRKSK